MEQKSNVATKVEAFIDPIVSSLGYDIVEVEYAKKQNGMNLTVFIDSPNGIKIEDCEKVHMAIDSPLDELDPTEGKSYTLNVSSAGLDRPLKTEKDLQRNMGQEVDLSLYSKVNGEKFYTGSLKAFSETDLTIVSNGSEQTFDRKVIAKITKHIEF